MKRPLFMGLGISAVLMGLAGVVVPLLPTTPFLILAAFCFARSNPAWEAWMLAHPRVGPAIAAWRDHGAIPRKAKIAAAVVLTTSAAFGWLMLPSPWGVVPALAGVLVMAWMIFRPSV